MPQLRLGIRADDLQVPGGSEEGVKLCGRGLIQQSGQEHPEMKIQRIRTATVNKSEGELVSREGRRKWKGVHGWMK